MGISLNTLRRSLQHTVGRKLSRRELGLLAWRLAGNLRLLASGTVVRPWLGQSDPEWIPVQITRALPAKRQKEFAYQFTLQTLAGTACPLPLVKLWSARKIRFLANYRTDDGHGLMFTRSRGYRSRTPAKYPYEDVRQLVGLRLWVLLDPLLCRRSDFPRFREVGFNATTTDWNRELLRKRFRVDDGYSCPFGKPQTFSCHLCAAGLDRCAAACHERTYVKKSCDQCGLNAFHDPEDLELPGYCVSCAYRKRVKADR